MRGGGGAEQEEEEEKDEKEGGGGVTQARKIGGSGPAGWPIVLVLLPPSKPLPHAKSNSGVTQGGAWSQSRW